MSGNGLGKLENCQVRTCAEVSSRVGSRDSAWGKCPGDTEVTRKRSFQKGTLKELTCTLDKLATIRGGHEG